MNAKTDWKVIAADFPVEGSTQQRLAHILKLVARAATTQEWQPCQFRLKDGYIELSADPGDESPANDLDFRELMMGCGAALFRLKLALKYFGCMGAVELFPDLGNTLLVSKLHHGSWHSRDWQDEAQFEALTGTPADHPAF